MAGGENERADGWLWPGGVAAAVCAFGIAAHAGVAALYHGADALRLVEALSRNAPYLGVASTTASATTLALMMTTVGLMRRADEPFHKRTYRAVGQVAGLATASLGASLLLLMMIVFPAGEFERLPDGWYSLIYDIHFALIVATVALLAATITRLFQTVRRVIGTLAPGEGEEQA